MNVGTMLGICGVLFIIIVDITSAQSPCKTPDNRDGNCTLLQQCGPLLTLATKNLTTKQRTFLRSSQCGYDGENVLVCCSNSFTINDLPSTQYCGKQGRNKIAGGAETTIYESPWMALLHYIKPDDSGQSGTFHCGGALIHENYVITAAHCVHSRIITQLRLVLDFVRLGEHDLLSNPDCQQRNQCADPVEDIPVAAIIVHEDYSHLVNHDIALLRLEFTVPYTDFIRPICLPVGKLQNRNYDGHRMILTGFGKTTDASRSNVKLKLEQPGFNLNECTNVYRGLGVNLTNGHLCAGGEKGFGSCIGDNGGPLVAEDTVEEYSYLVGVNSFAFIQCGTAGKPDVYTRVDQYIDWILDHMKK